jgi:hypothetical protein
MFRGAALNFEELTRQTAQELFDGTAVIFLGAGASMGHDSERAAGKGVPGSGALTEAVAELGATTPAFSRSLALWTKGATVYRAHYGRILRPRIRYKAL